MFFRALLISITLSGISIFRPYSTAITEFKISVIMDVFRKHGIERHTLRIWGRKLLEEGALWDMKDNPKVEMYYGEKFSNVKEFIKELRNYIEYYNNDRISLGLNGMSSVQYRPHYVICPKFGGHIRWTPGYDGVFF